VSCSAGIAAQCNSIGGELLVTSYDSNALYTVTPPPSVRPQFSATSAASSFIGTLAPGGLGSVFAATGAAGSFTADSLPLPTTLGKVTLQIGGTVQLTPTGWLYVPGDSGYAPLLYVDANQINFQVPPGTTSGWMQLQKPDGTTLLTFFSSNTIDGAEPALFSLSENGHGQGAVLNQ
jgi:uncharacterized protein (TIGR03437 family)